MGSARAQSHTHKPCPQKVTQIRVIESVFAETHEFVITTDSIKISFVEQADGGNHRSRFMKALSLEERNQLFASFDNVYLSNVKPLYEGKTSVSHDWIYDVLITKNADVKATRIFKFKYLPMYAFCKKLNQIVPEPFRISYTEKYFYD